MEAWEIVLMNLVSLLSLAYHGAGRRRSVQAQRAVKSPPSSFEAICLGHRVPRASRYSYSKFVDHASGYNTNNNKNK